MAPFTFTECFQPCLHVQVSTFATANGVPALVHSLSVPVCAMAGK